jgi:ADP-heptose:LPS heptosyltransferase
MLIISPFAKQMRNGEQHPKNYPHWKTLIEGFNQRYGDHIVQVGVTGEEHLVEDVRHNLSLPDLASLIKESTTWIALDSFVQHYGWDLGKRGIALWGQSDPIIFGHPENINLLKDRKYLREKQYWLWEQAVFNADSFVEPEVVLDALGEFYAIDTVQIVAM